MPYDEGEGSLVMHALRDLAEHQVIAVESKGLAEAVAAGFPGTVQISHDGGVWIVRALGSCGAGEGTWAGR
jgi:hypothetical protein